MLYKWLRLAGLLIPVVFLFACSGGGGSGGSSSASFGGLTWTAPSERENGDALSLSEIAGFRIYYGEESGIYPGTIDISDGSSVESDLDDVSSGKYFVVVTTIDTDGRESAFSEEVEVEI